MTKRNLTVQLDDRVITQAKVVAARRGLSLSALVAQQLIELAEGDARYERAMAVALAAFPEAAGGGPGRSARTWTRGELYDR